jgi:hypothetical protein
MLIVSLNIRLNLKKCLNILIVNKKHEVDITYGTSQYQSARY